MRHRFVADTQRRAHLFLRRGLPPVFVWNFRWGRQSGRTRFSRGFRINRARMKRRKRYHPQLGGRIVYAVVRRYKCRRERVGCAARASRAGWKTGAPCYVLTVSPPESNPDSSGNSCARTMTRNRSALSSAPAFRTGFSPNSRQTQSPLPALPARRRGRCRTRI